ncbi:MAG: hemerythrin family protein [Pseudomonadota bacterium]
MAIVWRSMMSIGDQSVDNDHKHLIYLINSFEESPDNLDSIIRVLKNIRDYALMHFEKEEALQSAIGYPDIEEHKKQHRLLSVKIRRMMFDVEKRESPIDDLGVTREKIVEFFRAWLIEHFIKEDLKLKTYIQKQH